MSLGATELLQAWERGQSVTAPEKALLLLAAASPGIPIASLRELSVGERDECLLALREQLFGRAMACVAHCPNCGEILEFPVDTRQFEGPGGSRQELALERGGCLVRFRVPTAGDLVACAAEGEVSRAEQLLLKRCVLEASREGLAVEVEALPSDLIDAMVRAMELADPRADLQVEASCPFCNHQWESAFDIVTFLWTELQDWAIRVLREVHVLALAYGWPEGEILDLSPWRRRLYLQMVGL